MGQDPDLEMEDRLEIGLFLINAWKTLSWQFLLDQVDHAKLASLTWKHLHTAAVAGGLNLRKWGLVKDEGLLGMARALEYLATHGCMHGNGIEMHPIEARILLDGCEVVPEPPSDFCGIWCMPATNGFCEGFDSAFGVEISSSVAGGNDVCTWRIVRKGIEMQTSAESAPFNVPLIERSALDRYPFTMSYKTEAWIIATRALLDPAGAPELIVRLISEMELLGETKAGELLGLCRKRSPSSSARIEDALAIGSMALGQKAEAVRTASGGMSMEIRECPFASAPSEICAQVEAFWKGVCGGCDRSLDFAYDRMMTKGDKTCHWTMRRKAEAGKEEVKEEPSSDDPVRTLTMRFARGEVTKEQYEEMMALIRKHYPR